jgi:hypothetical protein
MNIEQNRKMTIRRTLIDHLMQFQPSGFRVTKGAILFINVIFKYLKYLFLFELLADNISLQQINVKNECTTS